MKDFISREKRLNAILNNTFDGLITVNHQGFIEHFNPGAEKIFGYGAKELLGQSIKKIICLPVSAKEDLSLDNHLEKEISNLIGRTHEVPGLRKDGTTFHLEFSINEIEEEEQKLYSAIVRDISKRKTAEKTLLDSKKFQDIVMKNIPDLVFVKDENFRIIQANPAFMAVYPEHLQDKVIGYTTIEDYHKEEAEEFLAMDRLALETGFSETEEKIRFPDGKTRTLLTKKVRFKSDTNKKYILGVSRDITDLKETQRKLIEAEHTKESYADASNDGYWDWLIQEDYEYMSPRFWEMFGYDPSEKKHHPEEWYKIIFPKDLAVALDNFSKHVATKGKHPFSQEVRYRHQNGSTVHVICKGKVVEWGKDGTPIRMIGTHTDITRLKETQQELDDFAYIASHDLKEPLRGIHNHAKLLKDIYEDKLDGNARHRLDRMIFLSKRMEQLISDLLYYARLGRTEKSYMETNLNVIIGDVRNIFEDQKDVRIRLDAPLPTIKCNRIRVAELFRNLITNGIKYNQNEKKEIEVGFKTETDLPDQIIFYVKDNGIGIDKKFHEDIFKIFKRLHRRDAFGGGTGSGLTFVKKIIDGHGGKIWVDSEPGKGSVFYFSLPGSLREENK